jgi:Alpha amylase, catalytic domain
MLAEWESRDPHAEAFDMTYAWSWNEAVHRIAMHQANLNGLFVFYSWNQKAFPEDSMRMTFVSNHDKNAWEGTEFEQFGDGLKTAMVLSVIGEGMPLVYNGQEAGNFKRLEFFERDPIEWRSHPNGELYKSLFALKKANTALWNARWGARMISVPNSAPLEVLSFVRQNERDKVFAVLNFSSATTKGRLPGASLLREICRLFCRTAG